MGESAGVGSPLSFKCPRCRDARRYGGTFRTAKLTGKTRAYRSSGNAALGLRSTRTSRQYVCDCGHTGWSNHADLMRLAERQQERLK